MKKNVSIFVAGAQKLKTERYALKALVHELNTRYHEKNIDIHIEMKSYEDFKDKQAEYDNYITQKADIAIFVLDGCIGDYTRSEFYTAVKAYNQKQIPEIIVFLKKYNEETEETKEIQELLREGFGDDYYYVTYENESDLRTKAETRITRFVSPEDHIRSLRKWRMTSFLTCMIALLFIGGLLLFQSVWRNNKPIIIFAGGGSVVNFIKDHTKDSISIKDYPNSICMNLASSLAWSLLAEEAERTKNEEGGKREFVSICLSADKIDSTFFNEKSKSSFYNASVLGYYLGEDPLVVYVSKDMLNSSSFHISNDTTINTYELAQLIEGITGGTDKGRIFTTSEHSGTLRLYQKCLSEINSSIRLDSMLIKKMTYLFYQNSRLDYINRLEDPDEPRLGFLILGSKDYRAENVPKNNYKELYLKNNSGYVSKPMYMYFVASKEKGGFKIKKQVIDFLKDIGAQEQLEKTTWESITKGKYVGNGLSEYITYINDRQ